MRQRLAFAVPCVLVLLVILSPAGDSESAVSFVVNSTADTVDAGPGDSVCATAGGACTLRAAIQETNALPGADTITLPAGVYTLTIAGANENAANTGDLDITDGLTIVGSSAGPTIIDGNGGVTGDRVFHVVGAVSVDMTLVTVRGGSSTANGGGIRNEGDLEMFSGVVTANVANNVGGGIYNTGGGTVGLANTTISNNQAAGDGGGIYNGSTLFVFNSLVASNSTLGEGGGIRSSGSLGLSNVTVAINNADRDGGGIKLAAGSAALTSVTIASNLADFENDGVGSGGGISVDSSIPVATRNSIIAENGNCCAAFSIPSPDDCAGTISSEGYNLIGTTDGCTIANDNSTNLKNVSPMLGGLEDNGGPSLTRALMPLSPAIDTGNPAGCTDFFGSPLATDQRGYSRPVDGDGNSSAICDIGAFEYGASPPATPTPTPTPTPSASPAPTATSTPTASSTPTPTPTVTPSTTPTPTGTSAAGLRQGDVDCNGIANSVDSLKILRYVAQLTVAQGPDCPLIGAEVASFFGDVDCSGAVNSVDALKVLRFVAQLSVAQTEPCPDIGDGF